jgi:DNA-binding response OmpR family regulator
MDTKKKILVIEDDKDISRTIKLYLETEGFEVITVSDGKEGLQKAKTAGEDILILDLMLPGMPGEEICRELRKEEKYAALPIIMLTAKGTDAQWVRGMVLGANYYITKPFEMDDLLSTIQLLLKH